jgi:hypothetical protein
MILENNIDVFVEKSPVLFGVFFMAHQHNSGHMVTDSGGTTFRQTGISTDKEYIFYAIVNCYP